MLMSLSLLNPLRLSARALWADAVGAASGVPVGDAAGSAKGAGGGVRVCIAAGAGVGAVGVVAGVVAVCVRCLMLVSNVV